MKVGPQKARMAQIIAAALLCALAVGARGNAPGGTPLT